MQKTVFFKILYDNKDLLVKQTTMKKSDGSVNIFGLNTLFLGVFEDIFLFTCELCQFYEKQKWHEILHK